MLSTFVVVLLYEIMAVLVLAAPVVDELDMESR